MKKVIIKIMIITLVTFTYWAFRFMEECLKYFPPEYCLKCLE